MYLERLKEVFARLILLIVVYNHVEREICEFKEWRGEAVEKNCDIDDTRPQCENKNVISGQAGIKELRVPESGV